MLHKEELPEFPPATALHIKEKKFVTITHAHSCNTKLFVMRKNASPPDFISDFPSVSAIQGKFVMLRKFVMQNLQVSDCDNLFSFHSWASCCTCSQKYSRRGSARCRGLLEVMF